MNFISFTAGKYQPLPNPMHQSMAGTLASDGIDFKLNRPLL